MTDSKEQSTSILQLDLSNIPKVPYEDIVNELINDSSHNKIEDGGSQINYIYLGTKTKYR